MEVVMADLLVVAEILTYTLMEVALLVVDPL